MEPIQALSLLGGLSPAQFMRRHWQKKPLLVRQAIAGMQPLLSAPQLFALAARADVVATPHIGGMTPEAMEHQAMDTVRQIEALARGKMPEGAVNADAAFRVTEFLARLR